MTRKVVYYTAWYNNAVFGSIDYLAEPETHVLGPKVGGEDGVLRRSKNLHCRVILGLNVLRAAYRHARDARECKDNGHVSGMMWREDMVEGWICLRSVPSLRKIERPCVVGLANQGWIGEIILIPTLILYTGSSMVQYFKLCLQTECWLSRFETLVV